MKSVSLASPRHLAGTVKPTLLDGLARRAVLKQLRGLKRGALVLSDGGHKHRFGSAEEIGGTAPVRIEVRDPRFWSDIAFGGSIGAGEAWMHGYWTCSDLVALVRLVLRNREVLDGMESGTARLSAPLQKWFHRTNRNSHQGARRNIAAHYDLGNAFFGLWLDESLMYSCAVFERPDMSLHEAQVARLERICRKLDLRPSDRVVEIGTGWGGFALHAARHHGCHVTTTTISREQYELACERVRAAGLEHRITVLCEDFRDLEGQYDKLVSIEMIEAIDSPLYEPFFRTCANLLRPDGVMLLQAITIADQRYVESLQSVDFIQRYIFPGGRLPSSAVMTRTAAEHTDLRLLHLEDIGLHYAKTLRCWRENFFERIAEVRALGYSETFIRMWEYYLCYCEGAFLERAISDVQIVFARPEFLGPSPEI
ncbi:cyclopropane-fatty-acyl-phospholipid synthase family protein [Elongatibacter sediminis]|uniref:Cyclopropane-fatty-acyl-phospholipid synthase family protein n=1 Tax=Elongatibacter sediminis TaxID=3119006 RepID=A0AAW9RMA0_9GAMM